MATINTARFFVRPLSYENKDLAEARELVADYINHNLYIVDDNGDIHSISNMDSIEDYIKEHPDIITNVEIVLESGEVITVQNAVEELLKAIEDISNDIITIKNDITENAKNIKGISEELPVIKNDITENTENIKNISEELPIIKNDIKNIKDEKVLQTVTTESGNFPLLLGSKSQSNNTTGVVYFDSGVTLDPATNTINANISNNAGSATKLATARNITIGNATKSFDGNNDISFTLEEIGTSDIKVKRHTISLGLINSNSGEFAFKKISIPLSDLGLTSPPYSVIATTRSAASNFRYDDEEVEAFYIETHCWIETEDKVLMVEISWKDYGFGANYLGTLYGVYIDLLIFI